MSSKEYDELSRWLDDEVDLNGQDQTVEESLQIPKDQDLWLEQAIVSEMLHEIYNPEKSADQFVEKFEVYRDKMNDSDDFVAQTMQRIERVEQSDIKVITVEPLLKRKPVKLSKPMNSRSLSMKSWVGLAALFMMGLVLQNLFNTGPTPIAELKISEGKSVEVKRGFEFKKVRNGEFIHEGDLIMTSDSGAKIVLKDEGEGTYIDLKPRSELKFIRPKEDKLGERKVFLSYGELISYIAKRSKENPLIFQSPHLVTKITGTRINLKADGRKDSLKVLEGSVEALDMTNNKYVYLEQGQERIADAGYAMPFIDPLDSIVHEEFSLESGVSLENAKRKYHKRMRTDSDSLSEIKLENNYSQLRYGRVKGYIIAPRDGKYQFTFNSHEKAELMLATEPLSKSHAKKSIDHVTFKGVHRKGEVYLRKGQRYLFQMHYIFDKKGEDIEVRWSGPGFKEKTLSNDLTYSHLASI